MDENSTTSREGLPYAVNLSTALIAELIDTQRDLAIRQGKKGAKLKKEERVVHGFEKATIEKARRNQEELNRLKARWVARQKTLSEDMNSFDTHARSFAESFLEQLEAPPSGGSETDSDIHTD